MNNQTAEHLDKILGNVRTKHTPGEWVYGVRKDKSIWISLGDPLKGPHHQGEFSGTESDARLATAAPDLLKSLKEITKECVRQGIKIGPLIADAQDAIARAEGM